MRRQRKLLALLTACALLLSLLSGCGETVGETVGQGVQQLVGGSGEQAEQQLEQEDGLRLAYRADDTMNPLACETVENRLLAQLCYEGLFALDSDYTPQKVLCDSIERTGSRTYTLTIREGVYFHSGEELSVRDVVASLNAARQEGSIYQEQLSSIASVRYSGDEIKIRLYEPSSNLAALLDVPIVRKGTEDDTPCPDGTGPYQLVQEDSEVRLERFSDWNGGEVTYAEEIELIGMEDSAGEMNLLTEGGLSLVLQEDAESASVVQAGESVQVPSTRLHYLGVNCEDSTLDDASIRTALSMLMDRGTLVTDCFGGRALAASVPMLGVPDGVQQTQYDTAAALQLLADAGIYDRDGDGMLDRANGQRFTLEVIYNTNYNTKGSVLQQYARMLSDVGITLEATPLEFDELRDRLSSGDFELYYGEYEMGADFDAETLIGSGADRNFGGYDDNDMDDLLDALDEAEEDERTQALTDYLTYFCAQTPIIPIVFEQATITAAVSFPEGFDPWPDNLFHGIAGWSA